MTKKKLSIEESLQENFPDLSKSDRALLAVEQAIEVLYPKLTPEWEEQGYTKEDADEEGYLTDFEWDSETIEHVARALFRHGFGPASSVKTELEYMALAGEDEDDED